LSYGGVFFALFVCSVREFEGVICTEEYVLEGAFAGGVEIGESYGGEGEGIELLNACGAGGGGGGAADDGEEEGCDDEWSTEKRDY
jgi:hypothetical protein